MAKKRKLRQELSKFSRKTEKPLELISGALGIFIGGKQYVDIPTRLGYVFVRLRNNMSELIQAHNQTVSPIYDLPVLVVWNHNRYEIYGRDSEQYGSYWDTSSSFLPRHGFQHEFDPDNNGGGDLVFVHGEQFYPMMTFPSGTDGANTVLIAPYRYFYQGLWRYTGNTGVGDLLALGPTGANNAKLLLVGVTSATGNPFIKQGNEFSEGITGAAALTQFVPTSLTPIDEIPGAIIRLVTGTETITWANIYDARQYMGILQAGSGTAGVSTFLGLTDTPSSYSGQANKLVVVNSAETALEFRTNTGSFGGGGGGQIGIYGQDEAVGLGTGTVLNVTGDNVSLSISGTVLTLAHTNPTGTPHSFLDLTDTPDSYSGQGGKLIAVNTGTTGLEFVSSTITQINSTGIMAWDEGTPLGTGTVFNFRGDNIVATISGTVIDVYVTGSGGSGGGMTLISQITPQNTSTGTFSNIPSSYATLKLFYAARSTAVATNVSPSVYFNQDYTLANYRRTVHFGYGTASVGADGASDATLGSSINGASSPTGSFSTGEITIPFYAYSSFNKELFALGSHRRDASSIFMLAFHASLEWASKSAINNIDIVLSSGNFVSGSVIRLYGVS